MQKRLLILSFIEGAAVMAAELCGARLLAPLFGSSLYVWASVMGITLAALALGYFYGGRITERSNGLSKSLFRVLTGASLLLLAMPAIAYYLVPYIAYLPFIEAVIAGTILLLFLPIFFLGASSPLFIAIQTPSQQLAGKVSGTVYAISTAGGITATFLCGFLFIPLIGLYHTLLLFGSLLLVASVIVFKTLRPSILLLTAGLIFITLRSGHTGSHVLHSSYGMLGHMQVMDVKDHRGTVRYLKVNNIIQSEMNLETGKSLSDYVHLIDRYIPRSEGNRNALALGIGAGFTANLLHDKNYRVTAVEYDQRIIDAGRNYFSAADYAETICQDARFYLNKCTSVFDVIVIDLYKAEEHPSHILTIESLNGLKRNLSPGAVLYINWHGYASGKYGRGTSIFYQTLLHAGYHVKLLATSSNETDFRNIIFAASLNEGAIGDLEETIDPDKLPPTRLVNSDNTPVLEKYNASANKRWRSIYLRYYLGGGK